MQISTIKQNEGLWFIIKFLCAFLVLFYGNLYFISFTSHPKNALTLFISNHLNYIDWLRDIILQGSQFFSRLMGIDCLIKHPYLLEAIHFKRSVRIVYSCIGYGIMSFWVAFILANAGKMKRKLLWAAIGIMVILLINSLRVAIILYAQIKHWPINKYADHHTTFNVIAYCILFILIGIYLNGDKKRNAIIQ